MFSINHNFYFLVHVVHMKKHCDNEKINPEILTDSKIFNPPVTKSCFWNATCLYACLSTYVPMHVYVRTHAWYAPHSRPNNQKCLSILGQCQVDVNIPAPKT
jgi:hypothetical protein